MQVVTGAMNMSVGDKVPLALPGARLIDGHSEEKKYITLKPGKLRGVESEGMACSEKELGLSEEHEGILILDRNAPVGKPLVDILGDVVLDIEITPNMPHNMSVVGIAREVAALTDQTLRLPHSDWHEGKSKLSDFVAVEVADPDLAPRYSLGLVRNVQVKESPQWLKERLSKAGVRPINNIVDITNYVMMEWGQPQHAFDYSQVKGKKIIVRRAGPGEKLTTIDHIEREVSPDMLMICDADQPIGVAGVMGGLSSEIGEETKDILLESANFDRKSIRRTSKALKLRSEASKRFERGIDPEMTLPALRRAAELMRELAGGEVAQGTADIYSIRPGPKIIKLTEGEIERVLGMQVPLYKAGEILTSLGFEIQIPGAEQSMMVTVPTWRIDVTLPEDLIEEIARVNGYDSIPTTMMAASLPEQLANESLDFEWKLKNALVGFGLNEMISYSATNTADLAKLQTAEGNGLQSLRTVYGDIEISDDGLVKIANPLTAERSHMRPTLMVSGLEAVASNMRHEEHVGVFELGRVYEWQGRSELPIERSTLGIALSGKRQPQVLFADTAEMDFFDLKGIFEALLQHLRIENTVFEPLEHSIFHAGRAALLRAGDDVLAFLGEVSPAVVDSFEIRSGRVCLLEADVEALRRHVSTAKPYSPIGKFPEVVQDVAVVLDGSVPAQKVLDILREVGGRLLKEATLFDVYTGAPVPAGKKSLAFRLVFQAPSKTLTETEASKQRERMQGRLKKELGAELRAG